MYENLEYIKRQSQEYVVIVPSCMVFKQDYNALLQGHAASGADITALYHTVHHAKSGYETCHIFDIADDKVNAIRRNLGDEDVRAISMESFVMKKSLLIELIGEARKISSMYNLSDVINAKIGDLDVRAVEHFGFEDSVVARGVVIGKGAVIKGCYISAYTTIGENVHLENQVVDKYVKIEHENCICAPEGEVGYIKYMDTL